MVMTTVHVALLSALREVPAVELPSFTPAAGGRPLRHFALELHVPHERHQELEAELCAASAPEGEPLRGRDAAWRVVGGWTATTHGRSPELYVYRLEIQEVESPARTESAAVAAEGSDLFSEFRLELVVLPVSDVDRAKAFYQAVGFRLDKDHTSDESYRVVHMTPPGSPCSILFGTGVTTALPGTVRGLHLVVTDVERACLQLRERGVKTGEIFHDTCDMFHRCTDETRRSGPHPQRLKYRSYATFNDPDGNEWVLQEVPV